MYYYIVYRVTNNINGKTYIGQHKTKNLDDGYLGSGRLIRQAIAKYGKENFTREILHYCNSLEEMNAMEKELVVVDTEVAYNLIEGGYGGFGYINENGLRYNDTEIGKRHSERMKSDPEYFKKRQEQGSRQFKEYWAKGKLRPRRGEENAWYGKKHSEVTKKKIGEANAKHQIGSGNSQYGSFWVTNGIENRKCRSGEEIPVDFCRGRVFKSAS